MSESTADESMWADESVWKCQGKMSNGTPCKARAVARFHDADGTMRILCEHHAQRRFVEIERLKRALGEEEIPMMNDKPHEGEL